MRKKIYLPIAIRDAIISNILGDDGVDGTRQEHQAREEQMIGLHGFGEKSGRGQVSVVPNFNSNMVVTRKN